MTATRKKPKVSVILIDWGVRESFHSLHYLNRQTVARSDYELLWVEFYDHRPATLDDSLLDQWHVLGYPRECIFHKHRLYNAGILAARGDICVICDSDAMFTPTFIEKIIAAFAETPDAVVHLDEVRNVNQALYPFCYPTIEEVLGPGCINWRNGTTLGLDNSPDMLHHANYGACMAARRKDLLAIGGADEHLDYLGYVCGPYELTFRLLNYGCRERWLRDEYLYHTWHPNQYGFNTDHHGPHDGMHLALLALEARATFRIGPWVKCPWLHRRFVRQSGSLASRFAHASGKRGRLPYEPAWHKANLAAPTDRLYWVHRDFFGFDMFTHAGIWYALPTGGAMPDMKLLTSRADCWRAESMTQLQGLLPIDVERWQRERNGGSLPARLWRKLRAQPLHLLPRRVLRQARRTCQQLSQVQLFGQ